MVDDITAAVGYSMGKPCANRPADVQFVKRLLNAHADGIGLIPILDVVNSQCGPRMVKAIEDFQRLVMRKGAPYGRVQPMSQGGATLKSLLQGAGGLGEPRWLQVARQEIGVREVAGKTHNPRIISYHQSTALKSRGLTLSDETAWCASFVNWCLKQSGVPGTNSAAAASFVTWGRATIGKPGAVCVIYNSLAANSSLSRSGNHVGFLIAETPTHYKLLGGNQSDSVKISSFPKAKWRLKALRWTA